MIHTQQNNKTSAPQRVNVAFVSTSTAERTAQVSYSERKALKEVKCSCGKLLCKATPGSVVETDCKRCKKNEVHKVAA